MCVTVWYEPTDSEKACKPFLSDAWKSLSYLSPNLAELCTMNKTLGIPTPEGKQKSTERLKTVFSGSTVDSFPLFTLMLHISTQSCYSWVSCEKCK